MRNSSLVQGFCAENVPGLKSTTEALNEETHGRGALYQRRSRTARYGGVDTRENVSMSKRKDK